MVKSLLHHICYLGPSLAAEDKETKKENNCTLLSLSRKYSQGHHLLSVQHLISLIQATLSVLFPRLVLVYTKIRVLYP